MFASPRLVLLGLFFLTMSGSVGAQTEDAPERRLDQQEILTLREQTEADTALGEDLRAKILELCDSAISSMESARSTEAERKSAVREQAGVARQVEALRAELARPQAEPRLKLPSNATVDHAQSELARERSRLSGNRSALRDLERLVEERNTNRNEISHLLGTLDREIETVNDDLRASGQLDLDPALKTPKRMSLLAQRERAEKRIESLRAQLALLDARGTLLPWRTDKARRRVDFSEKLVAMLEDATRKLRLEEANESLRRVRVQCQEAAQRIESLVEVAAETESFAELLWGNEGIDASSARTSTAIVTTRKNLADLDRIVQLTRRKFEAFGHRGSIARWWPEIPEDFPEAGETDAVIRRLEGRIPEVQHKLIQLEEQRAETRKLAERTIAGLRTDADEEIAPELQVLAQNLFGTRRELIDDLVQAHGRYSNQLAELETVSRHFAEEEKNIRDFLYERLLWVRSVPRPIVPRARDVGEALAWSLSGAHWRALARTVWGAATRTPIRTFAFAGVLLLLVGLRQSIRSRLERLADPVADPATDSFQATLETLLYTLMLAAPLPLALYLLGRALEGAGQSPFLFSAAESLPFLAAIAALFEFTRQLMTPRGLAQAHFGWPSNVAQPIHRGLFWIEIGFLPLMYVSLQLIMAGMRMDTRESLQVYNNSLGRVAFIVAMTALGISLLELFRPRKQEALPTTGFALLHRLYVFAYPLTLVAMFLPAALAALGYYVTAVLLAYQMLRTIWLLVGTIVLSRLLVRWRRTSSQQAAAENFLAVSTGGPNLPEANLQTRRLFRFSVALIVGIGLFAIWSDATPTLQLLKRVQILPTIGLLESTEGDTPGRTAEAASESQGKGDSASVIPPGVPGVSTAAEGGATATASDSSPLTLWRLLKAILAGIIVVVLVRNIPGLLELTLRERTHLDSGARIALSTLARYAIMIIGVYVAMGYLGLSWSKIQWLAAALTFGLGFGLQEIVANFVSGLILLTERPVRVGDAVTVGNLQGRVSRIRMRATTITLWDRSEMVVPNKEFVTTKLINWTLSDSQRRVDIPVRIAYGADINKVKSVLEAVGRGHANVYEDPSPSALLLGFGDDAIQFELRFYVDFGQGLNTKADLHMAIDKAFRENGIEFALPRLNIETLRRRPRMPEAPGPTDQESTLGSPDKT